MPTSRATRVTSPAKALSWSTIVLMVSLSCRISPLTLTVIFFERSPLAMAVETSAMLRTWAVKLPAIELTAVRQILPGAGDARHLRLAAEPPVGADLACDARHLAGEGVELIHHRVDGVLELQDLAADIDRDLLREIAARDRGRHLGDVAHLRRQIAGHRVDRVRQILPRAGDARHLRLAAEPSVGADLAGDTRHLRGEAVELVDHRVDGVLELEDLALDLDGDLAREVAARDGGGHLRDVSDLVGQIAAHRIDRVRQILPRAGDARDERLAAELALGTDFAGDARDLRGEGAELVDHRVDGFLELQDLAAHVDGDLLREIAVGDRDRHIGDVAHLSRQIARHRVDALGQILPDARHLAHLGLAAELAVGADLAGDARHLGGEDAELLDHAVDDIGRAQEFALERPPLDLERHRLQEIAARHRRDSVRHRGRRPEEVIDQPVDRFLHVPPGAQRQAEAHALLRLALAPDHLAHFLELLGHPLIGRDDLIEALGDLAGEAALMARQPHGEIADADRFQGVQQDLEGLLLSRLMAVRYARATGCPCNLCPCHLRLIRERRLGIALRACLAAP